MDFKEQFNKKKILLISHNFSPEPTGIGKYNGEMMDWLARSGFDCTVVTTYPYYPYWKVQSPYKNRWYKKELVNYNQNASLMTVYRCPSYVPSNPTGLKRMIQDLSFWSSMFWTIAKLIVKKNKFDLIITVAPPFHLAYLGLMIRKYTGGKLLYHVQDLQIEAAQDLNMLSSNKLFERLYKIEKKVLDKADFVSSISEGMIKKITEKAQREIQFFPNWVDTNRFFPITDRGELKTKWGFQADDKVFLYSGAIGEKQGLESILYAAEKLINNDKIKFVICGSGPYKEKLIEMANSAGLINVSFLPVQEMDVFNEFLNMADLHLILQKSNASDLVMPSKLTTILAVGGVSLVTAPEGTSLYKTIDQYNLGYIIEPENTELLCKAIVEMKFDTDFELKKQKSREYALKYLNIDNVMNEFLTKFALISHS
ncbi:WcaI family glycosyltransferase [Mucilaginibacter lappiensis]|uniref:Colanic acid biosynthesis glycosyl transferase WcaI n=1 Tax=Mucilaginibacter lappiensis TaxID=354630 RepID=A0A1N7CKV0_9SPHI|nr:WcaI family glycosyltransferase [Mucilaginibacter lappiensis]MBB6110767.1 colanic acid biosynthesis glycosyl transferase WcaI [Mucilaginibacter lappiensis]MBB6128187.1 colanic acid biosynthesis glycosyl transferase WcaI [Mucilaginibacter lappiensis]SIR64241.1 colanic acid biosynthesis glycosyl transferase WcaI [Mucilaginibacter lappiensis]